MGVPDGGLVVVKGCWFGKPTEVLNPTQLMGGIYLSLFFSGAE